MAIPRTAPQVREDLERALEAHPLLAKEGGVLRRAGHTEEARAAYERAIALTINDAERVFLRLRCESLAAPDAGVLES